MYSNSLTTVACLKVNSRCCDVTVVAPVRHGVPGVRVARSSAELLVAARKSQASSLQVTPLVLIRQK